MTSFKKCTNCISAKEACIVSFKQFGYLHSMLDPCCQCTRHDRRLHLLWRRLSRDLSGAFRANGAHQLTRAALLFAKHFLWRIVFVKLHPNLVYKDVAQQRKFTTKKLLFSFLTRPCVLETDYMHDTRSRIFQVIFHLRKSPRPTFIVLMILSKQMNNRVAIG